MADSFELPLFPLNTVLFPGMYLPLHIFEERYKEMIGLCLREQRPFGVVMLREGSVGREPQLEPVGCTARILQMQPLEGGRMNIMTIGEERFRILSLRHHRAYLVGIVQSAPLRQPQEATMRAAANRLYPQLVDYLKNLARLGKVEFDLAQLPDDPLTLLYLSAAIIQLPMEAKQSFLLIDEATALFDALQQGFQEENRLLRLLPAEEQGLFSLN